MAKIDNKTYSLFGMPDPVPGIEAATLQSAGYTSTHSTFVVTAGSASFTMDFFSPVSPRNYIRQSMPFSYLTVSVAVQYGAAPSVKVYSDIDNSWTGQFGDYVSTGWTYATSNSNTHIFTLTPGGTALYSEVNDMAQWATAAFCTQQVSSNLRQHIGDVTTVRTAFVSDEPLDDDWAWAPGSVVAYMHDLGMVKSPVNVTFVIGVITDPAINYMNTSRTEYWHASTEDINAGCVHMFLDLKAAEAESRDLDASIVDKANSVAGTNYSDIVTLSVRQVFGAMQVTIPKDTLDTSDVMVFIKEISSNGNINTIDVIMPTSPIFYVMAPDWIRLTLEPVMRYLAEGLWPHDWAIHDIGQSYPNATGHNDGTAEQMPVEECSNVILLAYMYKNATGDTDWMNQYSALLKQYADYLVAHGLYPETQLSSDDGAGVIANQTGLAIKAAIALNAYGKLSGQSHYSDTGKSFANTLYEKDVGTDPNQTHFTLTQYDDESWGLEYNLFMDVLLHLGTFPTEAYAMQANYYPTVRLDLGLPLDSRVAWGKTDWMAWAAATSMATGVENDSTRDMFVDDIHGFLTNGVMSSVPFSDNFFVETNGTDVAGKYNLYRARPAVGGHFALMALDGPNQIQTTEAT